MQASLAPLIELARLCESYEARLIVDESHATGLFGKNLSGKVNELGLRPSVYCSVHTAGKALGSQGAWVAGDEALKKMLVNCSRGFIYSTAPAPQQCLTLASSLSYLEVKQDLAKSVKDKSNWLRSKLTEILKQDFELSGVPIIPIPVSSFRVDVDDLINELTQKNIIVSVIRYPTVAKGAECIRFVVRADQTDEELSILVKTLEQYL
jgi:8-amino-7-oxononanoate synthase